MSVDVPGHLQPKPRALGGDMALPRCHHRWHAQWWLGAVERRWWLLMAEVTQQTRVVTMMVVVEKQHVCLLMMDI